MGTLERVMQMRQQGVSESQIAQILRQEGISPREINEAFSQSKIKSALNFEPSKTSDMNQDFEGANPQMQPSLMYSEEVNPENMSAYPPESPMSEEPAFPAMPPEEAPMGNYARQMQPPSPYAAEYPEYQPQQATDIGTINDIAEQIVEEKIAPLKKQIITFTRFKEELALDVEKINERLTKIENTFNELQMAIIRKIGEYGDDVHNISKELHSTQDSFSKIINPLTDNIREMQKMTGLQSPKTERPRPQIKQTVEKKQIENARLE